MLVGIRSSSAVEFRQDLLLEGSRSPVPAPCCGCPACPQFISGCISFVGSSIPWQVPSSETKPQPYLGHNSVLRSSNRDVYFRIKPPCFSTKEQTLPWASQNTREDSQLWSSQGNRAVCTALLPAHRLQPNSCFQCFPLKGRSWLSKGLFRIH